MKRLVLALALLAGCRGEQRPDVISPGAVQAMPAHRTVVLDPTPKAKRRAVPAEVFLRAYLSWFGELVPNDVFLRARGNDLFDQWAYYLAALGLPDYHVDAPRISQSNTVMLATIGRLGEALCVRSVERDLRAWAPLGDRIIFAFEQPVHPTVETFAPAFDVLHRTFLGYPATLAPKDRIRRFFALYREVASRRAARLTPDEMAWAAVCTALVQHPEAWLY